ncbi:MAG: Crp/Fnr family transcriptional regulator [Chitinophagaceae bacterium]|nr:Crp/Fnr family transcriptional regulator [Chitinophagaceae bacterium]
MKKEKGNFDASGTFLYRHCLKEWWPALDAHRQVFRYKKGEIIFKEGDVVQGVFFMIDGVVKVHKQWTDDKELIIRFARQLDIIGHRGLSTHDHTYPIGATVLADAVVCFITMDFFRSTLAVNPGFAYEFLMFMADELQLSEQRMRDLAHMQVKGRVAKALLSIEKKFSVDKDSFIAFTLSRQDIASYTGTTYETVYKLLAEFSEAGFIKTNGKDIALLNREGLIALTQ